MDSREALAARNRRLAEAYHRRSFKERIRRAILFDLARLPIPSINSPPAERMLLVRPDHLGDVLLTTPAIQALRRALPNAELHALVGPWSAGVLTGYDEINVILTLPFPGFSRTPKTDWRSPYRLLLRSARQLRQIGYSSAIIFRPDHWWGAMLAKFAGIPERIGYNLPEVGPFLTRALERAGGHAVEQSLRLVERWTGPRDPARLPVRYTVHDSDRQYITGYLEEWNVGPAQRVIVLHPGSGTWVKRWDDARWSVVADTLAEEMDAAIVFTGSDHELPLVMRIADRMETRACFVVGDTSVGQLAALYERSLLVLGPDSGPLHLAVAVGTPTVALFGPADPAQFGPWGPGDRHIVLTSSIGCRPCRILDWTGDAPANHPCMRDITIAQVLQAARRAVQSASR